MRKEEVIIGAHFSIKDGILGALNSALHTGANAMQVFAKNPMSAKSSIISEKEALEFEGSEQRKKLKFLVIHAPYLLNFGKKLNKDSYEIKSLRDDVISADRLGGAGAVIHFGKSLTLPLKEAEKLFIENLNKVADNLKETYAKIIIENTAGQGTEMAYEIEKFAETLKKLDKNKFGACLDTAHLFGAGCDLSINAGAKETVQKIEELLGWERVVCVHFNDSKKPLGSRVDRHQDIGYGEIGKEGLKTFMKEALKLRPQLPFILETTEEHKSYKEQIEEIRSW